MEKIMHTGLYNMCLSHFNEPVLVDKIGRCIGYAEDEQDCYIIIAYPGDWDKEFNKRESKIVWHTCVGGYIWLHRLKGQNLVYPNYPSYVGEIWDDFERLDMQLSLNGCPKQKEFKLDIRK